VFDRVKGPYCWDVDGNKYIDYIGSWGPAIVGAANDEVNEALRAQIEKGTSFGAPSALEVGGGGGGHQHLWEGGGACLGGCGGEKGIIAR
jgi:glutamate-1-semialdehyde aminotransferase